VLSFCNISCADYFFFSARKLQFIDCETYLGNQSHCIGMLGCNNVYANRKMIHMIDLAVLRNSMVTVIADCIRREVRWEVDGKPYPYKASFDAACFPKHGATFRFAVGGSGGSRAGRTKIINEMDEVLHLFKEVNYLHLEPHIQKLKQFLDRALEEVQIGSADSDFHFHYDLEASGRIAQLCINFIHACGFEDSNCGPISNPVAVGCRVQLSQHFAVYDDAKEGPLKPGDIGTVVKSKPDLKPGRANSTLYSVEFSGRTWWYSEHALFVLSSGSSSRQLGLGAMVSLSSTCTDHALLKPGNVGQIIQENRDGSWTPFKVSCD
jgi:hypothetical protein